MMKFALATRKASDKWAESEKEGMQGCFFVEYIPVTNESREQALGDDERKMFSDRPQTLQTECLTP